MAFSSDSRWANSSKYAALNSSMACRLNCCDVCIEDSLSPWVGPGKTVGFAPRAKGWVRAQFPDGLRNTVRLQYCRPRQKCPPWFAWRIIYPDQARALNATHGLPSASKLFAHESQTIRPFAKGSRVFARQGRRGPGVPA